jgi:hypothetical protein
MRYLLAVIMVVILCPKAYSFPSEDAITSLQRELSGMSIGKRIARWAEEFVGTPYDPDPMGEYVTRMVIVADERVDCMYHTFRSIELAMSFTPEEAVHVALDKRFLEKGIVKSGKVVNYDQRFQYAIDMLKSGKWGRVITKDISQTEMIEGSRGIDEVNIIPRSHVQKVMKNLLSGDIVFFVKDPSKRVVGEIVGHIGIIKREGNDVYLIHASGRKNRGGKVKKVLLEEYTSSMPFIGIIVSRFK